jgi:4-hydroxy-tetrahydrodipicolinate reductase
MADALGLVLDDLALDMDVWLSPTTYTGVNGLVVEEGTIGALRWSLAGVVAGEKRVVVNHINRIGPDAAPDWPKIGTAGGYRIEIDGMPPFVGEFPLGLPGGTGASLDDAVIMTAARCVNSIAALVGAAPGYLTLNDLPTIGARHGMRFSHGQ